MTSSIIIYASKFVSYIQLSTSISEKNLKAYSLVEINPSVNSYPFPKIIFVIANSFQSLILVVS